MRKLFPFPVVLLRVSPLIVVVPERGPGAILRTISHDGQKSMSSEASRLWKRCRRALADQLPAVTYNTWIKPIRAYSLEDNNLHLALPNSFHREWLRSYLLPVISQTVNEVRGGTNRLHLLIQPDLFTEPSPVEIGQQSASERRQDRPSHPPNGALAATGLKTQYNFDTFIAGDCNKLARSAGMAVAVKPGVTFNPLMIYGAVGLGKTHLAQAIGHQALLANPRMHVQYVTSEQFTTEFVEAVRQNRGPLFTRWYRAVDLLIVDDVQFFSGKEKTQEEFCHVFNALHDGGKQIVMCADRPPGEIEGLEERVRSRLRWGLATDLKAPEYETRVGILRHKANQHGLALPPELVDYVAVHVTESVRGLEGALNRLLAHQMIYEQTPTIDLARQILSEVIGRGVRLDVPEIQQRVAAYYGLDRTDLVGRSRQAQVVRARHVAMYFVRLMTHHTYTTIGSLFDRDHSSVIHGCRRVEVQRGTDAGFAAELQQIACRLDP